MFVPPDQQTVNAGEKLVNTAERNLQLGWNGASWWLERREGGSGGQGSGVGGPRDLLGVGEIQFLDRRTEVLEVEE